MKRELKKWPENNFLPINPNAFSMGLSTIGASLCEVSMACLHQTYEQGMLPGHKTLDGNFSQVLTEHELDGNIGGYSYGYDCC